MKQTAWLGLFLVGSFLVGCAPSEAPAETAESERQAQAAASAWTPEQVKKFEELNKAAREGKD
ncbi:MAG: hypothetical protein MUC92_13760 [Fimbriimonadaceae bacterium]|jgi:hypothetical protein|nr:hypothetical protein [Fimbriimonadaceae bacterium]